jgi:glycosyltransferase involved in cell wall biosynthesis
VYRGHSVAVVMPAYNVESHIERAIRSVPGYVDLLVVVDDGSRDGTAAAVAAAARGCERVVLLRHPQNRGVGAAIATGYGEARRRGAQVVAVMAGDGQMDPADLPRVLDPVVDGRADYCKGNRFLHADVWRVMPRLRLVGNVALSLLTKLTSGYWRLFDSQCGYTAISSGALRAINGGRTMFARYGYPNDVLARLRVVGARVEDVPVRPVYEGQPSGIRLWTVIYPVLFVLLRSMGQRLWRQRVRPLLGARDLTALAPPSGEERAEHLLPAPPP